MRLAAFLVRFPSVSVIAVRIWTPEVSGISEVQRAVQRSIDLVDPTPCSCHASYVNGDYQQDEDDGPYGQRGCGSVAIVAIRRMRNVAIEVFLDVVLHERSILSLPCHDETGAQFGLLWSGRRLASSIYRTAIINQWDAKMARSHPRASQASQPCLQLLCCRP